MSSELLVAICGVIATLVSPFVVLWFQQQRENSSLSFISKNRRSSLTTKERVGTVTPDSHVSQEPFAIKAKFICKGKVVSSFITYQGDKGEEIQINLKGGFYDNRFLKLDYADNDPCIIQFGIMLFELNAEANLLAGRYLGYGRQSQKINSGEIVLQK